MALESISMGESGREEISKQIETLPDETIKGIDGNKNLNATYIVRNEQRSVLILPSGRDVILNVNIPRGASFIYGEKTLFCFNYRGQRYTIDHVFLYEKE